MKELTVIIPFKNEGEQVYKTVRNIDRYVDSSLLDIICINDCSDDGVDYQKALLQFDYVRYIENEIQLGVAGSRDKGVFLAETKYVFLLDGHMRMFEDIITPLLGYLRKYPDNILFSLQSRVMKEQDGKLWIRKSKPSSRGASLKFDIKDPVNMFDTKWDHLQSSDKGKDVLDIPCVLGAAYAMSREYYLTLHGLNGLALYGNDEALLSTKVWLSGGRCKLLPNLEMAHLYRKKAPYSKTVKASMYNRLVYAYLFLPEKFLSQYIAALRKKKSYQEVLSLIESFMPEIEKEKTYLDSIFTRSFDELLMINEPVYANRIYPE